MNTNFLTTSLRSAQLRGMNVIYENNFLSIIIYLYAFTYYVYN